MTIKEIILNQIKVVKAGIKSANGKAPNSTTPDSKTQGNTEVTTEIFLDSYLNK